MRKMLGMIWRRVNRYISRAWLGTQITASPVVLERFGEGHAAWYVRKDALPGSIAYCGGVGQDATFDFGLATGKRLQVHSFDPTPGAIAYMERENHGRVHFHPWGMLDKDQRVKFYAPRDRRHANWFTENIHKSDEFFEADCYSINSIMRQLGHDRLDLLKIDVEGSWFKILKGMLDDRILPPTLCVEFDSPASLNRVRPTVRRLQANGYQLVRRERENCVFIRSD
jgi:FkbM family methyltransferase